MIEFAFKAADVEARAGRTLQGMVTTEAVDAQDEVIIADGVTFRRNEAGKLVVPLLAGHNDQDPAQTIGKMRDVDRRDNGWWANFFVHPLHEDLWQKARDGLLMFSVGIKYLDRRAASPAERERWPGVETVVHRCEVYEVSLVACPANAEAIVTAAKSHQITGKMAEWLTGRPLDEILAQPISVKLEPAHKTMVKLQREPIRVRII